METRAGGGTGGRWRGTVLGAAVWAAVAARCAAAAANYTLSDAALTATFTSTGSLVALAPADGASMSIVDAEAGAKVAAWSAAFVGKGVSRLRGRQQGRCQ